MNPTLWRKHCSGVSAASFVAILLLASDAGAGDAISNIEITADRGVPRIIDATPRTFAGQEVCVCGIFPGPEARNALLLDSEPIGAPMSAASDVAWLQLPAGLAPGRHVVTGAGEAGFPASDRATILVLQMGGDVDSNSLERLETTPMRLWVKGTTEPIELRVLNKSPSIISIEGGDDQVIQTSGGEPNMLQRTVRGLSPGDFDIEYELVGAGCPCAATDSVPGMTAARYEDPVQVTEPALVEPLPEADAETELPTKPAAVLGRHGSICLKDLCPQILMALQRLPVKGDKGEKGDPGERGQQGAKGDKGDKGDPGERGQQGGKGDKGDSGEHGQQGGKGDKGDPGERGQQGGKGDKGDPGERGQQGGKGDKGEPGERGQQGAKGDKGDPGERGLPGSKGDQGDHGEAGLRGPQGESGPPGPQGPPGAQGPPGENWDIAKITRRTCAADEFCPCDLGAVVIGGGASCGQTEPQFLQESYPFHSTSPTDPQGWKATCVENEKPFETVHPKAVWVICLHP